jgi:hypothetical protein
MENKRIELGRCGKGSLQMEGEATILHVKGTAYERGWQHGYLLHEKIAATVPKALTSAAAVCGKAVGGGVDEGLTRLRRGMEEARGFMPPEFVEEIRGLSDALASQGSPLDFQDMLMWNLMYDTWCFHAHPDQSDPSSNFVRSPYPETIGCSSFSAWGNATRDGKLLFGKNMDNLDLPGVPQGRILVFCDPDNGFGHANVTQAGMLAIDGGFNEAGICMMTHYSGSAYETMRGCGIGTLTRLVLQNAASVEDGIDILNVRPRCTGVNYHIADAKANRAAVVEANAKETAVRRPFGRDMLWSTNHCNCFPGWMGYQGKNMVEGQKPVYRLKDISTIEAWQESLREKDNSNIAATGRFRRYEKLLGEAYGNLSLEKGMEILSDRHNPDTGELRDWDTPAKGRNDGMTISYLLPRRTYSENARFYKSEDSGSITGQSTNLWSAMAAPASGDLYVALEGLPAHRRGFRYFNLFEELGR